MGKAAQLAKLINSSTTQTMRPRSLNKLLASLLQDPCVSSLVPLRVADVSSFLGLSSSFGVLRALLRSCRPFQIHNLSHIAFWLGASASKKISMWHWCNNTPARSLGACFALRLRWGLPHRILKCKQKKNPYDIDAITHPQEALGLALLFGFVGVFSGSASSFFGVFFGEAFAFLDGLFLGGSGSSESVVAVTGGKAGMAICNKTDSELAWLHTMLLEWSTACKESPCQKNLVHENSLSHNRKKQPAHSRQIWKKQNVPTPELVYYFNPMRLP